MVALEFARYKNYRRAKMSKVILLPEVRYAECIRFIQDFSLG